LSIDCILLNSEIHNPKIISIKFHINNYSKLYSEQSSECKRITDMFLSSFRLIPDNYILLIIALSRERLKRNLPSIEGSLISKWQKALSLFWKS